MGVYFGTGKPFGGVSLDLYFCIGFFLGEEKQDDLEDIVYWLFYIQRERFCDLRCLAYSYYAFYYVVNNTNLSCSLLQSFQVPDWTQILHALHLFEQQIPFLKPFVHFLLKNILFLLGSFQKALGRRDLQSRSEVQEESHLLDGLMQESELQVVRSGCQSSLEDWISWEDWQILCTIEVHMILQGQRGRLILI